MKNDEELISDLLSALRATLKWIDAVPSSVLLPALPGFDRDWVDEVVEKAESCF